MSKRLYVGNIPFKMVEKELVELFTPVGNVIAVFIVKDKENGRSKGYGFVEMENPELAKKAIESLNGQIIGGRILKVSLAIERVEKKPA